MLSAWEFPDKLRRLIPDEGVSLPGSAAVYVVRNRSRVRCRRRVLQKRSRANGQTPAEGVSRGAHGVPTGPGREVLKVAWNVLVQREAGFARWVRTWNCRLVVQRWSECEWTMVGWRAGRVVRRCAIGATADC